jgi:Domain of unknown function (DUF4350)
VPVNLNRRDRKLVFWGILFLVLMTVGLALVSPKEPQDDGAPSSYSTKKRGGKAAYLLLTQLGYKIERWDQHPSELPVNPQNELLIIAGPTQIPDRDETNALQKFVAAGGTMLIAGAWFDGFAPNSHSAMGKYRVGWAECQPAAPTKLTRGGVISMDHSQAWDKDNALEVLVHYKHEDDPVVVSYMVGRGEVIWWASALPVTNAGIRDKNNLNLLINSLGEGKHILWDEYFHTEDRHDPFAAIWGGAMKAGALQCVGLALLLLFTFSRRSGPVVPLLPESRLSPLEFVDTLGNLYGRAGAAQVPVEIAFTRFRQLAVRRLGLYGSVNAQQLAHAMMLRRLVSSPDFAARLQRCEDAIIDPDLNEKEALALVQFLNQAAETLQLTSAVPQEKRNAGDTSTAHPQPK